MGDVGSGTLLSISVTVIEAHYYVVIAELANFLSLLQLFDWSNS